MAANRSAIVSSASSQVIGSNRPSPFAADPLQRPEQPIGAVDPVEEPRHLLAEKPPREPMVGIAPQLDRHAVLTVTSMLHVSGQSSGQTFLTTVNVVSAEVVDTRVLSIPMAKPGLLFISS